MSESSAEPARPEPAALRLLGRLIGIVNALALTMSAFGVLVSLALIAWSVLMRYVFNKAPIWVDEVVGFMLVAIVMLAAADVLRRGEHIGVDLFTANLKGRARLWVQAWSSVSVFAVALILIVNGWQTAMFSKMLGIVTEGHLEWPVYWLMLLLPLGGLLLLATAIEAIVRLALGAPSLAAPPHGSGRDE